MSLIFGLLGNIKILGLIGAGIAFVFGLFKAYSKGKKAERDKQAAANLKAVQDKKAKDNEVNNLSQSDLDKRLGKWMSDGGG